VKPLRTETAFHTPWFELVAKTMREGEPPFYSLKLPDYAAIVALTDERKVLTVRQYRPALERYTLELPSGLVDAGEQTAESAARELLEETGYRAASVELLGPLFPDNGRLGNRIWNCFAEGVVKAGVEPEAGIEVQAYDIAELLQMTAEGTFDHSLHVAALLLAQLRGKL